MAFTPNLLFRGGRPIFADYTNPSSSAIVAAGAAVVFGSGVRISHVDIAASGFGALAMGYGIYEIPNNSQVLTAGSLVWLNSSGSTPVLATSNNNGAYPFVGIIVQTSVSTDANLVVLHLPARVGESDVELIDNTGGAANAGGTLVAVNANTCLTIPIGGLANLANGQTLNIDPGFNGRVLSAAVRVNAKPASTASKAATLTVGVAGTVVTGGVITLTTANCNTAGAQVPSTAITASNTFTTGQAISVAVSSVTAFVEGDGFIELQLANTDLANNISTIVQALAD